MRRMVVALALALPAVARDAQVPAALGKCIVEHLGDRDRTDLARWVFLAMAAHPGLRDYANAGHEAVESASRTIGALTARLTNDVCAREAQAATAASGTSSAPSTLQFLTQLGVQELMTNREALSRLSTASRYAERDRIGRLAAPR